MKLRLNPELQLPPKQMVRQFDVNAFNEVLENFLDEIKPEPKISNGNIQNPVNNEENKSALSEIESWFQ